MKPIAGIVIAAAISGAIVLASCGTGMQCDEPSTLETVKSLLNKRLQTYDTINYLLRESTAAQALAINGFAHFAFSGFRERGKIGNGLTCAAVISVMDGNSPLAEMTAEYSVEPTSDGKVMVSARFAPN